VLTRLAESFVRFGSFEVFYHRGQHDEIRILADFLIRHHFPDCQNRRSPTQHYSAKSSVEPHA
jgi:uncharacterized protein YdiU (UPF0061 family)